MYRHSCCLIQVISISCYNESDQFVSHWDHVALSMLLTQLSKKELTKNATTFYFIEQNLEKVIQLSRSKPKQSNHIKSSTTSNN